MEEQGVGLLFRILRNSSLLIDLFGEVRLFLTFRVREFLTTVQVGSLLYECMDLLGVQPVNVYARLQW